MSELGEISYSPTPILDRLDAQQKALEPRDRQTKPKNMFRSVQSVMGLEPLELEEMFGTSDSNNIPSLIKKGEPHYDRLRQGFLTSSYLLFNVRPEHTPESWKEYLRRPIGEREGKSIINLFRNGQYEEILQEFETPAEEEQAA